MSFKRIGTDFRQIIAPTIRADTSRYMIHFHTIDLFVFYLHTYTEINKKTVDIVSLYMAQRAELYLQIHYACLLYWYLHNEPKYYCQLIQCLSTTPYCAIMTSRAF